jgi:hypothetical protein
MNLPETPGLKRRLAYAQLVREAHFPQFYQRTSDNLLEYEIFYNLRDVSVGLIDQSMNMTSVTINATYDKFCVICQEYANLGSITRTLSCEHSFHILCIDKWLNDHTKCPTCNKDVRQEDRK